MSRNEEGSSDPGFEQICSVMCDIENPERMRVFLEEVLTPAERRDLGLRWELMRQLKKGIPQRKIAKNLGISLCKITRGAKILKQGNSISKDYLDTARDDDSPVSG